jgi:hypothetical protein
MTLLAAATVLLSVSRGSSKEATKHYRRRVTATFDAHLRAYSNSTEALNSARIGRRN